MSSVELPDDVWIGIARTYLVERHEIASLASTSRRFRDLSLPIIYHDLTLRIDTRRKHTIVGLTNISEQVDYLLKNPYLLYHIRELRLVRWKPSRKILLVVPRATYDALYSKVIRLFVALPQIHRLRLHGCSITPKLHLALYQHPSLAALNMAWCSRPQPLERMGGNALSFQELSYISPTSILTPYFTHLLQCCLSTLCELIIQDSEVSDAVSTIGDHPLLALRTLAIRRRHSFYVRDPPHAHQLLMLCPEIRELQIDPYFNLSLMDLPHGALPHLSTVTAPADPLFALVPGRALGRIHIHDTFTRHYPSVTPNLRFFTSERYSEESLEQLQNEVTSLSFTINNYGNPEDMRDIMGAIIPQLSAWTKLRVLRITLRCLIQQTLHAYEQAFTDSHIARSGDPSDRGHPSLEEICFSDVLSWMWLPDEGWILREIEVQYKGKEEPEDFEELNLDAFVALRP